MGAHGGLGRLRKERVPGMCGPGKLRLRLLALCPRPPLPHRPPLPGLGDLRYRPSNLVAGAGEPPLRVRPPRPRLRQCPTPITLEFFD